MMMNTNIAQLRTAAERYGIERLLAATMALLAALVLIQGVRLTVIGFGGGGIKRALEEGLAAAPARVSKKTPESYAPLLEHGIFGKVVKSGGPKAPPLQLMGVLGDGAMLGTSPKDMKVYKAGEKTPTGATIVEVRTNEVVLETEGKESTLQVFPDFNSKAKKPSAPKPGTPPEAITPKNGPPQGAPGTAPPRGIKIEAR